MFMLKGRSGIRHEHPARIKHAPKPKPKSKPKLILKLTLKHLLIARATNAGATSEQGENELVNIFFIKALQ
jgi:hypothetical protein